jgi:hypothetical protein
MLESMKRRKGGNGTLVPGDWCPLFKDKEKVNEEFVNKRHILTKKQKEFIKILEGRDYVWTEGYGNEWRTAVSLSRKGIVEIDKSLDTKIKYDDPFLCRLTIEGMSYWEEEFEK